MKFMLTFAWRTGEAGNEGIARFKKTGAKPPRGAKLLGRWTRADFNGGFDLIETDDPKALTQFAVEWNDLCDLTIVPVIEDGELSDVLKHMGK